jgi:flagellar biosynthesis protein FlhF
MKIKKIVAPTMKDAIRLVKLELGEDAIILKSEKTRRGGIFSFLQKEVFEVTAAIDYPNAEPSMNNFRRIKGDTTNSAGIPNGNRLIIDLRDDIQRIDGAVQEIGEKLKYPSMPSLPSELQRYYITLVENGVDSHLAGDISQEVYRELKKEEVDNPVVIGKAVQNKLRALFSVAGNFQFKNGKPTVVALIGPTGVGKTTTVAKIASQTKFFAGKKVALISSDTYRLAAVEHLRTFARIAGLPLEIVYQPLEMESAIRKHQDKDLLLIDTAGRSHRDTEKMRELRDFMEAANPDQVHLTLSAGVKFDDLLDIVERFKIAPSNYLLFTKLDETSNFGNILNLIHHRPKPISILTFGQNVPEDITLADKALLARLILSRDLSESAMVKGLYDRSSIQTERISV